MSEQPNPTPPTDHPRRAPLLVVTNAILLLLLVVVTIGGRSHAQGQPTSQPAPRARGEYTLLSPHSADGNTGTIVVIDSINEEMAVLEWDKTRRTVNVTGYRDLTSDTNEVIGR